MVQYIVGVVVPFFNWIDGLWQLWDKPFQQCLHDKAVTSVVVRASSTAPKDAPVSPTL